MTKESGDRDMKNKTRALIAAFALIALSACSSNGKILGQYSVKGEGATTLNRDTSGKSLSVVIRTRMSNASWRALHFSQRASIANWTMNFRRYPKRSSKFFTLITRSPSLPAPFCRWNSLQATQRFPRKSLYRGIIQYCRLQSVTIHAKAHPRSAVGCLPAEMKSSALPIDPAES